MAKHTKGSWENKKGMTVEVRAGNLAGAMKLLDRRMKQEGVLREFRESQYYEKPTLKRRRKRAEAQARQRKLANKLRAFQ